MKAMVINGFGGPEVLQQQDMPKPDPGPTQLLVRVHATSVNAIDYKVRQAGEWAKLQFPAILGWDVSGVVAAIGPGVKDFQPGDEVFYVADMVGVQGAYAEYHVVEESLAARKPRNLSHAEAAAVPLAGGTAWEGVVARGRLKLGETALIHGAGGGVGTIAVQLARAAGAYVFGTCSAADFELVKGLGVDRPIDYRNEDFVEIIKHEAEGRGVDFVLDTVGGKTISRSIGCTKKWGRLVTLLNVTGSLDAANTKNLTLHFESSPRYREKLDALRVLLERGQIKPVIDSVLPLEKVAEAHSRLEHGGVKGKIVLEV